MEKKSETIMEVQEFAPNYTSSKPVTTEVTSTQNTSIISTESEFTRANIEALGISIKKVDQDETSGLDLFCYVRCGPTDEGLIRECRGVVFHGQEVVMKAFPYTIEYNHTETEKINETIASVFEKCTIYDAQEGALIRMFNFGGKWFTSTHRKLNAFRSKWASHESFGSSFKKALDVEIKNNSDLRNALPEGDNILDRFQTILDPKKQYMFLVRNTLENRIVCSPPENPTVYHVGTFVDKKLIMTDNIFIPYPKKHNFKNIEELYNYVANINPVFLQGVIVFAPDNKQYKILNKEYQDFFRARGNEPSIKFRYLQVRMNKKQSNMLYYLYPDSAKIFDQYENILFEIAKSIYRSYVNRFIKKRYVSVPREEFTVIRDCHNWYLENREEHKISQQKIIEVLNQQSPTNLNKMIHRFNIEQDINKENEETKTFPIKTMVSPGLTPILNKNRSIPRLNIQTTN